MRDQRLAGNGGRWGDKFLRADRKWQSWQMRDYSGDARVFPIVTEEKARLFPNRIALHFGETSFSYEALHLAVNRYANGFLALGIRPGDRVALMLPNCPEALFAWWGLSRIGAVDVPVNTALRGEGLAWQIGQARCVALMIGHDLLDRLEPVLDDLPLLRTVLVRAALRCRSSCRARCWRSAISTRHRRRRQPASPAIGILPASSTRQAPRGARKA